MSTAAVGLGREERQVGERRVQTLQEAMEQRFDKLNQDLCILQSRTGIKKQQVTQKTADQLMSLLAKKLQQYSFPDTVIGQNHYKLVQKGMDAPQLERKLQEQRFLAEKELSNSNSTDKSMFWMDIQFSKQGIDNYLENNQNFVIFKSVDTMRSHQARSDTFGSRLLARKAQLRGSVPSDLTAGTSALNNRFDQFSRLDQDQSNNMDIYLRAMKQFSLGNYAKYAEYLAKNSRSFKEVWQLLERMVSSSITSTSRTTRKHIHARSKALQNSYHNGVSYLEMIYRKNGKQKKQSFQRIYDVYNVDAIRSFEDENIPLWQELYQLFRAGDYENIFNRCNQYNDVQSVQEFGSDLLAWLNGNQQKNHALGKKIRSNWDAFRYQIYLVMMKDPQCVDDVFIEDLDDCLWMNLKCCEAAVSPVDQVNASADEFDDDVEYVLSGSVVQGKSNGNSRDAHQFEENNFYDSIFQKSGNNLSYDDSHEGESEPYSWIDWNQLQDLRKMLNESFKESPDVFNPSRMLMIQLLTLDFIGFANTLRNLEKNGISQHEMIHMLILLLKSGLVRTATECAKENGSDSSVETIVKKSKDFEDFAEKQILLYTKETFETYPETALSYIETLPISREAQLSRFADIIIGSSQNTLSLFKDSIPQHARANRSFDSQITTLKSRLKNQKQLVSKTSKNPKESEAQTGSELKQLARIVAKVLSEKQHKAEMALEILDGVGAFEDAGSILKEQYRIASAVFDLSGMKNQLRSNSDSHSQVKINETFERYAEKYFGKKSRNLYEDDQKRKVDAHIIEFFRLCNKIKQSISKEDYYISGVLLEMQDSHFISSSHKVTAANEFYETLKKHSKSPLAYFDFLYLLFSASTKFFEALKTPSRYNQQNRPAKSDDIEKAKQIFKSVADFSITFYEKNKGTLDKEFEKILTDAKNAYLSTKQTI